MNEKYDVVVVGAGNAALCAALSAHDHGARVLVLEVAPERERGGNTAFTAGAMRVAYRGVEDILELCPDLTPEQIETTNFGTYDADQFYDDLCRVTEYRTDPELADIIVRNSFETLKWMRTKGVKFNPIYGRQAFKIDGKFKFWGGLTIETWGGGPGLVDSLSAAAAAAGIEIRYETRAIELLERDGTVVGVKVRKGGVVSEVEASAVILGAGGFEANPEWRTRYLGQGYDLAKVRGSRFNMGDGIKMALDLGALPWGHWSGAHAVGWELNAPPFGDLAVGDGFQKHSYPFGIMVNANGERFVDEGADFRNYTYAKYGHKILAQPQQFAWQIFDQKVIHLLRDEYRIKQVTKVAANTLEELAAKLEGVNAENLLKTLRKYNDAVATDVPFNPNVKDGRRTVGLDIDKTNWANTLDEGPFEAYAITCGVTFTFGGLRITPEAEVVSTSGEPIPGLFACGELVGGIFYFNYPGGSGLTNGSVFGRIAGASAGDFVKQHA
ncbi:FAD-dependent tricarballylate dehydrogenase TcuA [Nocardioides sp. LMS-CY]|uniref:Tricarballylate dehydrogenase n=1 Tax=Nocardioides soli TaxID=1036020 RepID=A0A7W4VVN6_9ACTN|nr:MULTISPECIES: FAD-dependent tricarballylate dehydrogenase TcuA [Nocardioides]MBB3042608.1 tricarballylate dehydrogenase [Nocardioides soli]QWF22732.1 FAD-dependent tricarballylate dehydrogenase TcuA [Nocardioides sp. LMS-CY]